MPDRVARVGDVEVGDRDGAARRLAVGPRDPPRGGLRRGHAHGVTSVAVDEEVRLLAAHRRRRERGVRRVREAGVVRCALDAREHLVPHAVRPAGHLAVAGEPLLLRAVDHERQAGIGDEAAAGELRAGGAVVHQREVPARDVEAAHRDGLRHGPEVRRRAAPVLAGAVHGERQVRDGAPEVHRARCSSTCRRRRDTGCRPRACR